MKNQVTTIYKQAERFAEITKTAIIKGNIIQSKKMFGIAERLFATEATKQKMPFRMSMFFLFPLLWNCVIAVFPIYFQNR